MKLVPNETADALQFALRLTEVSRWGIVATSRQQSVGEHSYRVVMIALAMYDYMENGQQHNSFERAQIASFAMVHDIAEVLTGDIDSVFKAALKAMYPEAIKTVEDSMAAQRRDTSELHQAVLKEERGAKGTLVEIVVKIADMLEALIYITDYGSNAWHRHHVYNEITSRLFAYIEARKRVPVNSAAVDWKRIEGFVNLLLGISRQPPDLDRNRSAPQNVEPAPV